MMTTRLGAAIACGTLVTLGLLWLMTTLISLHAGKPIPPRQRGTLDFYEMTREEPVRREHQELFRELTEPVDVPPARPASEDRYDGTGYRQVRARAPLPDIGLPPLTTHHDGPLVAMVRVQPAYPPRAIAMNLDGWVIVRFDVTADGLVTNATAVESSHRVFEKAAIDTVRKFRYKPRVVDGQPQPTTGLQNLFRFEIDRT